MREHDDVALKDYTFTMAEEVREKIKHVDNLHELISEESVVDLHRVDVTDELGNLAATVTVTGCHIR